MSSRLAKFIALIAAVHLLGGHWLALQSVAWVGMIAKYSQEQSFTEAIKKTFDGDHPCSVCKAVKQGRDQEQQQVVQKTIVKLDAVIASELSLPEPLFTLVVYSKHEQRVAVRTRAPLTPPPLV